MQFGRKKSLIDLAQDYVEQVSDAVLPPLEAAFEQAIDKATPALQDARDLAVAKVAELKGEPEPTKGKGRLKKALLVGGLVAIGVVVFKKVTANDDANWQSAYVPTPPPGAQGRGAQDRGAQGRGPQGRSRGGSACRPVDRPHHRRGRGARGRRARREGLNDPRRLVLVQASSA